MESKAILETIRKELFYGSADYTKNQPDLFIPHRFKILAGSQTRDFLDRVRESLVDEEVLLYVHFPFCFSECLFCNSFPYKTDAAVQSAYIEDLLKEIDLTAASGLLDGKKVRYIYFGGGTPTAFPNSDLERIIDRLSSSFDFSITCGINTEAHPSTLIKAGRVEELAAIGFNRVSIGCQTFDPEVLRLCKRKNSEELIARVVGDVQGAGMSINIDMMTGLPGQTIAGVEEDLRALERLRPNAVEYIRHEIVNPLSVALLRERPELVVGNNELFEMVCLTQQWMIRNGFEQNGRFTGGKHWEYRYHWLHEMPIIAFGARARSYSRTICYDKHEELGTYAHQIRHGYVPIGRFIILTEREQRYRTLLLSLQLKRGLDVGEFRQRFGADPLDLFAPLLSRLREWGCIRLDESSIALTEIGSWFIEDICDVITDTALKEDSENLVRDPHSRGTKSARL